MSATPAKNQYYSRSYLIGIIWQLTAVLMLVSMAAAIKRAASLVPVADIVYYRCSIGFFIISLVAVGFILGGRRHLQTLRPRQPGMIALRAMFNLVAMAAGFYAVANIQMGTAAVLSSTKVFFLIPLSALFLAEKSRPVIWLYNLLAFGGAVLILAPPAGMPSLLMAADSAAVPALAGAAALAQAFFVAAGIVTLRALGRVREHPVIVVFWVAAATALAVQPIAPDQSRLLEPTVFPLLLLITLLGLGGQFCNVLSYRYVEAPATTAFSFLRLALSILYGFAFFAEVPGPAALVGMLIIILVASAAARRGLTKMPIKRGLQMELRDAT